MADASAREAAKAVLEQCGIRLGQSWQSLTAKQTVALALHWRGIQKGSGVQHTDLKFFYAELSRLAR